LLQIDFSKLKGLMAMMLVKVEIGEQWSYVGQKCR